MKPKSIVYLSHGPLPTGGFQHESFLAATLQSELGNIPLHSFRQWKYFKGVEQLYLVWWGFWKATASINIVVGRLALPAILRNLFTKRKVLVVLHHFDKQYFGSFILKVYYYLLIWLLRQLPKKRFAIITVSPFWVNECTNLVQGKIPVFHFPNLFDVSIYASKRNSEKSKSVCLGQWSSKNHPQVFALASKLKQAGFQCYFASLHPVESSADISDYAIFTEPFDQYLNRLARCYCSVAFPYVKEGWNRVAHESMLLGTPLVAYPVGGLADLAQQSGCTTFNNINQAFDSIVNGRLNPIDETFIKAYNVDNSKKWALPIVNFCSE